MNELVEFLKSKRSKNLKQIKFNQKLNYVQRIMRVEKFFVRYWYII